MAEDQPFTSQQCQDLFCAIDYAVTHLAVMAAEHEGDQGVVDICLNKIKTYQELQKKVGKGIKHGE